ncbi:hypothetical protein [Streptomyces sp. NPDC045714]|uniref:hypothetical protein n=1 Tax=Streptomyces sp. NPDC045714 TaxID=3154913 RepID=UPI0033CBA6BF
MIEISAVVTGTGHGNKGAARRGRRAMVCAVLGAGFLLANINVVGDLAPDAPAARSVVGGLDSTSLDNNPVATDLGWNAAGFSTVATDLGWNAPKPKGPKGDLGWNSHKPGESKHHPHGDSSRPAHGTETGSAHGMPGGVA